MAYKGRVLLAFVFMLSLTMVPSFLAIEEHQSPIAARILQASYTVNINVTVTDNAGRSIGGATIHIAGNGSTWLTNDAGYYEITGLSDAVTEYTLYADKLNYLASSAVSVPVTGNQTYFVTLRIIGGTILGTVTSMSGNVTGATVKITDLSFVPSADVSPINGTYALTGIPGGNHSIVASAPGYIDNPTSVNVIVAEATQLNFVLTSLPGNIAGYVLHVSSLDPISNASVSVNLTDKTIAVLTGDNGSYLIPGVPEGTYIVVASKEGYYSQALGSVVVNRDETTTGVNFTLSDRPTALYGTVRSSALLLRQVNVSLVGTSLFNITDASGDYRIENITAGSYNVTVERDGYKTKIIQDVQIPLGASIQLDIDLEALPGAVLLGTVFDRDDPSKVLYNVVVTIFISETQQRTELTDPLGHFGFTELAPGNYTLQFEVPGYSPLEIRGVEVEENETINRTFPMEPLRTGFEGFIFGFDLAHSMMILALFITIVILAVAVYLRYRTFQTPETAPAVYDHALEPVEGTEGAATTDESKEEKEGKQESE